MMSLALLEIDLAASLRAAWNPQGKEFALEKVIVTSYVFGDGVICWNKLEEIVKSVGANRLTLDLSCRLRDDRYFVVTDRWQTFTDTCVTRDNLDKLGKSCAEFLVHAVDLEGRQLGVDERLIENLADWSPVPVTYAGGARTMEDIYLVEQTGRGRVDVTVGSALDIFGGSLSYDRLVEFDQERRQGEPLSA